MKYLNNINGIILLNKPKGITSRDLVNEVSKKIGIKKVGHAGTLDPLATGLMIIGVGTSTKILDLLTLDKKEYIATVKIGIQTDTLDITGNIVNKVDKYEISKEKIIECLNHFKGSYFQEVPKYSAVKINGKRLYNYARSNEEIELPKREVNIYDIKLLDFKKCEFSFKVLVSKGTFIRSLINDIGNYLNIPCTMKDLVRTKSGKFKLENSIKIDDKFNFIPIQNELDFKIIKINDNNLIKKIKNGNEIIIDNNSLYITLIDINDNCLAIYKNDKKNNYKAFKVF